MKTGVDAVGRRLHEHRFWLALIGAVLIVVAAATLLGSTARARGAAYGLLRAELEATADVAEDWQRRLESSTPAESLAWRRSEATVRDFGVRAGDRFGIAQVVADRAEQLGFGGVTIDFIDASTLALPPPRSVGPLTMEPASYALDVRFPTDYQGVISFVGSLPPQVAVMSLRLGSSDRGIETALVLVVYEGVGDGRPT